MRQTVFRTERTEARLRPDQKARIERAAALQGISLSDFIVQNADDAAVRTIHRYESWTLNTEDRDAFIRALLDPPSPGRRLKAAAKRHRERTRSR